MKLRIPSLNIVKGGEELVWGCRYRKAPGVSRTTTFQISCIRDAKFHSCFFMKLHETYYHWIFMKLHETSMNFKLIFFNYETSLGQKIRWGKCIEIMVKNSNLQWKKSVSKKAENGQKIVKLTETYWNLLMKFHETSWNYFPIWKNMKLRIPRCGRVGLLKILLTRSQKWDRNIQLNFFI